MTITLTEEEYILLKTIGLSEKFKTFRKAKDSTLNVKTYEELVHAVLLERLRELAEEYVDTEEGAEEL